MNLVAIKKNSGLVLAFAIMTPLLFAFSDQSISKKELTIDSYVQIGTKKIAVQIADSKAEIEKGLSNRSEISDDEGMLFVFDRPSLYKFWMKDMNFPIDIVWINDNRIVSINENVPNNFDPSDPIFYSPTEPALYVLEIKSGLAKNYGLKLGDDVDVFF